MKKNYLSYTMALTLQAIENGYGYGFDIMAVTGLASGTVYPALRRLESADYEMGKTIDRARRAAPATQVLRSHQSRTHRTRRSTPAFPPAVTTRTTRL